MEPRVSSAGLVLMLAACGRGRTSEFHVLDGGAGELLALDAHGIVLRREACPGGRLLAADGEALWIAGEGQGGGRLERRVLDEDGARAVGSLPFRSPRALAPGADGDLYLLDGAPGEPVRLWQVEPWLTPRFLGEFPEGTSLAWEGSTLLLGTRAGALLRLRRDGAVLAAVELGAPLVAVRAEPGPAGPCVLLGGPTPRLVRLEHGLEPRWSAALSASSAEFALDGEQVWLVEGERLVRLGADGGRELSLPLPLRGGPWHASLARGSRTWLRGRGAWLEVDSAGTRAWIVRAQGGFEALSAAVRRRAGAASRRAGSLRRARPRARARGSW